MNTLLVKIQYYHRKNNRQNDRLIDEILDQCHPIMKGFVNTDGYYHREPEFTEENEREFFERIKRLNTPGNIIWDKYLVSYKPEVRENDKNDK